MSQALQTIDLPAEAITLINDGKPRRRGTGAKNGSSETLATPTTSADRVTAVDPERRLTHEASAPANADGWSPRRADMRYEVAGPSASITVRVPGALTARMLRIATDRKLARIWPFTQQGIVVEAITQWLERNGY
jgi:hypothetical protein